MYPGNHGTHEKLNQIQNLFKFLQDQQRELENIRAEKTEVEKQLYFKRKVEVCLFGHDQV